MYGDPPGRPAPEAAVKKAEPGRMIFPWKYKALFIFTIHRILTRWEPERLRKNRRKPLRAVLRPPKPGRLAQHQKQSLQNRRKPCLQSLKDGKKDESMRDE